MANPDMELLLREAARLSEAAAQTARGGKTQQSLRQSFGSRVPTGSQAVGDVKAAQELLLGGQATAPSPVSYALGAIPTALRVNQNPGDRLDILREFADNPRSSTYQRVASEAGAGPRAAAVAGTAAEFLEPGPDIGPLINAVPFVPGLLRRFAGRGRPGNRASLRIARASTTSNAGPVMRSSSPQSGYWTTDPDFRASYAALVDDPLITGIRARGGLPVGRSIEGELLLNPDTMIDITDDVAWKNIQPGTAEHRFMGWIKSLLDNPAVERVSGGRKRARLQEVVGNWESGIIDTQDMFREVRNEIGRTNFDRAMRSQGFDAFLQFPEEGLKRLPNAAEVVVLNPRAVRPINVDDPNAVYEVFDIGKPGLGNSTEEMNDLLRLYSDSFGGAPE